MIALICGPAIVQCTDPRLAPCDAFLGQTQVLNRFRKGGIDGKRLLEAGAAGGLCPAHEEGDAEQVIYRVEAGRFELTEPGCA